MLILGRIGCTIREKLREKEARKNNWRLVYDIMDYAGVLASKYSGALYCAPASFFCLWKRLRIVKCYYKQKIRKNMGDYEKIIELKKELAELRKDKKANEYAIKCKLRTIATI